MSTKINGAVLALAASLLIISAGFCDSSSAPTDLNQVQQVPMTDYMRSQVGTPNELSPLAPAAARNIHKEGDHWVCELNGQTFVFDGAHWVPQAK